MAQPEYELGSGFKVPALLTTVLSQQKEPNELTTCLWAKGTSGLPVWLFPTDQWRSQCRHHLCHLCWPTDIHPNYVVLREDHYALFLPLNKERGIKGQLSTHGWSLFIVPIPLSPSKNLFPPCYPHTSQLNRKPSSIFLLSLTRGKKRLRKTFYCKGQTAFAAICLFQHNPLSAVLFALNKLDIQHSHNLNDISAS